MIPRLEQERALRLASHFRSIIEFYMVMNTDAVILIVDDEKDHADVLVEALEKQCAKAIAAYSADEAIELIESENFDLVITDLNPARISTASIFLTG